MIHDLTNDELEAAIDKHGLRDVLLRIAYICTEKADHILVSYNDSMISEAWAERSAKLCAIAVKF